MQKREPGIVEIALGEKNYVYKLNNRTEGGDVTMCSYISSGQEVDGLMLLGVNAWSEEGIIEDSEKIAKAAGVREILFLTCLTAMTITGSTRQTMSCILTQ